MFHFSSSTSLFAAACVGTLGFSLLPVRACGPDFPNAYLATPADEIAGLPTLCFAAELARLRPPGAVPLPDPDRPQEKSPGDRAEQAEVRDALVAAGVAPAQVAAALASYVREQPPAALPREFHLYAQGARAWHAGHTDEAVAAWRALLALPAGERYYRTVWAEYMIGRALWDRDGEAACAAFRATRAAAGKGFADSEGLATASLGWEARVSYQRQASAEAMRLYFAQFSAGDPTAVASLQSTVQQLFPGGDEPAKGSDPSAPPAAGTQREAALQLVAADPQLRGIVTAWFVARGGPFTDWSARATGQFKQWLSALPHSQGLTPAEADRWAWAAYQNGLWSDAAAFARLAPPHAAASEWVRAMLLLRAGEVEQAANHLAGAAHAFPQDPALTSGLFSSGREPFAYGSEDAPAVRLGGVRGVLALQRAQYVEALRLFRDAGHWADAAYVAERILTVSELTRFVNAEAPAAPGPRAAANRDLRHLLARRLVRAGQFEPARAYFPDELVPVLDDYVAAVRTGYREDLPAATRARALWKAAEIVRDRGMELQGTELAPDYAIWGGSFEWPDIARTRGTDGGADAGYRWPARREPSGAERALVVTTDEIERTAQVRLPGRRYHYRQRAAELAFLAASLLPNDNDLTALILNTAGRWVAARYPDDAQLFYKTLVFRCPHTALGREAAARRWLVPPAPAASDTPDPAEKI